MAQILVRNIDDQVKDALRARAEANGRSLEEEVRLILSRASLEPKTPEKGLGTQIAELFANHGLREDELPPRDEIAEPWIFNE